MKVQSLGLAVSLAAAAAQTAVDLGSVTPFADGFDAVGVIAQLAGAGSFVAKIQTCDTDSATDADWTDVVTMTGAKATTMDNVTLKRFVRANVTAAGSAGAANFYLLG